MRTFLYVLLGNGIVAAGLAIVAPFLGAQSRVYLAGLLAAVVAFLVALPISAILHATFPQGAPRAILPFLDPAIEEPCRIFLISTGAALLASSQRITVPALTFAFGYALFESAVKAIDTLVRFAGTSPIHETLVFLSPPAVVLMLHLTLSLVAALMFAQGSRLPTVLAATFGIHSAHNGSVYLLPFPTDLVALALNSFLRVSIFAAVIAYCLSELRKLEVLRTQSG